LRHAEFFRRCRAVVIVVLALFVAACATSPLKPAAERPLRQQISHFSFDGTVAARQGDRVWNVGVSWDHQDLRDEVMISGPLGQGLARIVREDKAASLTTADRKRYAAEDADALARDVLGLPLPVTDLPRWLLGDVQATRSDDLGRPLVAAAGGWVIFYREYESARADALPRLVELKRDDLEVLLRIDQWNLE
jgi:outer membrane lipoprotein LolB